MCGANLCESLGCAGPLPLATCNPLNGRCFARLCETGEDCDLGGVCIDGACFAE